MTQGRRDLWKAGWLPLLREKRAQGLSATEIAAQMSEELHAGFSRNSIIGKLNRERIPLPNKSRSVARQRKREGTMTHTSPSSTPPTLPMPASATTPTPTTLLQLVPVGVPAPDLPCRLVDLPENTCRWPVNEPPSWRDPHLFCGMPSTRSSPPYCEVHYEASIVGYRPREPAIPADS